MRRERHECVRVTRASVLALVAGGLLAASCAAPTKIVYTPEEARAELTERLEGRGLGEVEVPFAVSDELAERARVATRGAVGTEQRLRALVELIAEMQYDLGHTATANEAFEAMTGDCITATNLFVGMSRAIGLETYFVEAVGVEDVSAERGLNVHHRHVLAAHGREPGVTLVDFNRIGEGYYRHRILSDIEAMALFFNTKGYQALRDDEDEEAARLFRIASWLDPKLAWAHNNLGVALRRQEKTALAEVSFRRAIAAEPAYAASYRNLARLLFADRREEQAAELVAKADELDRRDPLRHYERGMELLAGGESTEARRSFRRAVRLSPRFVRGWIELGRAYRAEGDEEDAERAFRRALDLDPDNLLARGLLDGELAGPGGDVPTIVDGYEKTRREVVATSKIEAPPPD